MPKEKTKKPRKNRRKTIFPRPKVAPNADAPDPALETPKRKRRSDRQIDLIPDLHPPNAQEIVDTARAYKDAQRERMRAGEEEAKLKDKLRSVVKESDLQLNQDGEYRFRVDGVEITVQPRDELVKVKFPDENI